MIVGVSTPTTDSVQTRGETYHEEPNTFINRRPSSFTAWFKTVWLDLLTLAITGAASHGVSTKNPAL